MSRKVGLGIDVLTAAQMRISYVFDRFQKVCVSFSGGKDSTVLLHLTANEARRRGRRFSILFIDWEAQYRLTIEHVENCLNLYADIADIYWIALPLTTWSGVSMIEPEWTCWDAKKRDLWVRPLPYSAITDGKTIPFYRDAMSFEEFVPAFNRWWSDGKTAASLVGIRADESLNRFRTLITKKSCFEKMPWTTWQGGGTYNAYPIYDWKTADIWTYHARTGLPHNEIYDRMHKAGLTINQMRICEPYGNEQRRGLWLFHILEPETWPKIAARVAGANSGALYAQNSGNVLGNRSVSLPEGHTWRSFTEFLLATLPPKTGEHYRNKIAVYVKYCMDHYPGYENGLPETAEGDTGGKDVASWRRVCRAILRNDYWCRSLSFSPTKSEAYDRYVKVMKNRRAQWKVI